MSYLGGIESKGRENFSASCFVPFSYETDNKINNGALHYLKV